MATNGGFGLNYNKGFGSGAAFVGGGADPSGQYAAQAYQQRLGQQKQNDFGNQQLQQQLGFSREKQAQDNALTQQGYNNQERIAQQGYASQQQIARMQADASDLPARLQQQRFDSVFPYLSQQLAGGGGGSYGGGGGGGNTMASRGGGVGGASTGGSVYNDKDIQQSVNASRAANDSKTAGAQRQMQQQMSARGYGSNSPLAQELGVSLQNKNLAANTEQERQLRFDAAGANADQAMKGAQLSEQSFANRNQEDIERQKVYQSKYNALIAALSGMV